MKKSSGNMSEEIITMLDTPTVLFNSEKTKISGSFKVIKISKDEKNIKHFDNLYDALKCFLRTDEEFFTIDELAKVFRRIYYRDDYTMILTKD